MKRVELVLLALISRAAAGTGVCRGPDGHDGTPGMQGAPGRDGRPGENGDTGDAGMLSGVVGEQGKMGPQGDPGQPGSHGSRGFVGPSGSDGEPGPPGPRGQKGESGEGGGLAGKERPAFSVVKITTTDPRPEDPIIFDKFITNEGDCFNIRNGIFYTCKPGWYYFTYNIVSEGGLCINIMKNDRKEAGFCDVAGRQSNWLQYQMNSGGTVLQLRMNDRVWLETTPGNNQIFGSEDINSVFSGFLIFPAE
uniref:complement C1q subcomponent subunit A-like n=1 Tax=Pristiophorus japonicus TaxID=55135 RepID=UPI00398E5226